MSAVGFCTNDGCARALTKERIERYPGPGEFCPSCGDALAPEEHREHRPWWLYGACATVLVCAFFVWQLAATAWSVRVCSTTMTSGIANAFLSTYTASHHNWPYHFTLTAADDHACDVRFFATKSGHDENVIARDGIVAIVNPANSLHEITPQQLSDVFAGRLNDWSQLGGRHANIVVAAPARDSDEMRLFPQTTSPNAKPMQAGDIVRLVTSPAGANAIGLVPFSMALAAKVLTIAGSSPPSTLSIVDERYPMTVRIVAGSDLRRPSTAAADFVQFAHSKDAGRLLARLSFSTRRDL